MFNLKIANIERLLKQRNNSEIIQNTSPEIADYINSICQDNKKCEQYYFQQILKLDKKNSLTLENIKNIKYQDTDKISIKEEYKIFIDKLSREIRGFNKIPNLQEWVIKQLPNVLVEDYNEFFIDIKTFASLQDDERFQYKDITRINSPKELRQIVTPFIRSEIISTTTNKEWVGEWIYNKDEVSVFKSYDPSTISQISKKYQTRWCIKDPDVAKNTYKCETQPMYFVFIGDNVVCVIHLETTQIKDVADLALSDISIIKKIDPVLQELKLTTDDGDFTIYYKILNRNKEISLKMDSLDQQNKINYAKELLLNDIEDINVIDKNLIIYNKELQDIAIKKISDKLGTYFSNSRSTQPLTISQDLYLSIPRIREIYIKFWEEMTKKNVYYYVQYCPSYIGKEKVIQDSFIIGMDNRMQQSALSYLRFKGSYPEIINRNMDKFKKHIEPCIRRMKEEITNHPEDYQKFQESKENIPEIFNNPETVKSFEEILVNRIVYKMEKDSLNYITFKSLYPEIINSNMDKFKKYIDPCIESMKEEITNSPETYETYQESKENIPEIFNNPEIVKSLDEKLVIGIAKRIKENPIDYVYFKNSYPEIFNKPEVVKTANEVLVIVLGKEISKNPDYYPYYQAQQFSEIFDNPEIVKKLNEALVTGIKNRISKDTKLYSYYKKLFPEIFNNPEIVKSIEETLVTVIKKDISQYPLHYLSYEQECPDIFNNPEIVKSLEEIFVPGIKKQISQNPDWYKKTFPKIFKKYNILPPEQTNQTNAQLTTSNNWYKLFKSSQKNRISI